MKALCPYCCGDCWFIKSAMFLFLLLLLVYSTCHRKPRPSAVKLRCYFNSNFFSSCKFCRLVIHHIEQPKLIVKSINYCIPRAQVKKGILCVCKHCLYFGSQDSGQSYHSKSQIYHPISIRKALARSVWKTNNLTNHAWHVGWSPPWIPTCPKHSSKAAIWPFMTTTPTLLGLIYG